MLGFSLRTKTMGASVRSRAPLQCAAYPAHARRLAHLKFLFTTSALRFSDDGESCLCRDTRYDGGPASVYLTLVQRASLQISLATAVSTMRTCTGLSTKCTVILPVFISFVALTTSVTEGCAFSFFRSHMNPRSLQGPLSGSLSVACARNIRERLSDR